MIKVLFVCLGNICRSPAAEGVFAKMIKDSNLSEHISCDSAGTSAYHEGEPADGRMSYHASERGYDLTSLSRPFLKKDFKEFDYIIAMDRDNYEGIMRLDPKEKFKDKVHMMTDYCTIHEINEVPDPYFGGDAGFELVMDIVEDGCTNLLKKIQEEQLSEKN